MFRYQSNIDRTCSQEQINACTSNDGYCGNTTCVKHTNPNTNESYYFNTDDNTNNYACFGYSNVLDCVGENKDDYLYRIIGIDKDTKEIQLIKASAIKIGSNNITVYHSTKIMTDWGANMTNPQADLAMRLNGTHTTLSNLFINSTQYPYMTENGAWFNKISSHRWKSGILNSDNNYNGNTAYSTENSFSLTPLMKIGLLNASDIFFGYTGGNPGVRDNNRNNWIYSDVSSALYYELTVPRYDLNDAWIISGSVAGSSVGHYGHVGLNYVQRVRPTFFLKSDTTVSAGNGAKDNPFIIEINNKLSHRLMNDESTTYSEEENAGLVKDEILGGMYRYTSASENSNVNNYICLADNANICNDATQNDKYLYRIIGITKNDPIGNLDGLVKIVKDTSVLMGAGPQYDAFLEILNGQESEPIFKNAVGYEYLNNLEARGIIVSAKWNVNYESGTTESSLPSYNALTQFNSEYSNVNSIGTFNYGLAYVSDFLFSNKTNNIDFPNGSAKTYSKNKKGWMYNYIVSNSTHSNPEWTMTKAGRKYFDGMPDGHVWTIESNGDILNIPYFFFCL